MSMNQWILTYVTLTPHPTPFPFKQELPIFQFEEVHDLVKKSLELLERVDPQNEHLEDVQEIFADK